MPETTGNRRRSAYGDHAKTEPFRLRELRDKLRSESNHTTTMLPAITSDRDDELEVAIDPWPGRFHDAWKWFGLSLTYLFFAFFLVLIGLVMTKGLMLIWEVWLRDLGN